MKSNEWVASALNGVEPHEFAERVRRLIEESPPEVRRPAAVADGIRDMGPGPEQYFWLELAESSLADPLVRAAIVDKFGLLDRRFALHIMIELIADASEMAAVPALARCASCLYVNDLADSLSCRAFEVLWMLDREAARVLARSENNFSERPNLSVVWADLEEEA